MFGWLKGAAQNAVYSTTLATVAKITGGDAAQIAVVRAGAAQMVVSLARKIDGAVSYRGVAEDHVAAFSNISTEMYSRFEQGHLSASEELRRVGFKMPNYMAQIAAGYWSTLKRKDFSSGTGIALLNAIHAGASSAFQAGCDDDAPLEEVIGAVAHRLGVALND